jgi:hypothetical protein
MRFRKSIKLAPGLRMNLSGSGVSWTLGPRGASIGIGRRGSYLNTGIPGTGLYSRQRLGGSSARSMPAAPSKTTTFTATVSIDDDGQISFRDESGEPLSPTRIDLLKKQKGDLIHGLIEKKCAEINHEIEALGEIHTFTPPPNSPPQYVANSYNVEMPYAPEPKSPGFLGWLFRSVANRIASENSDAQKEYEDRLAKWHSDKSAFEAGEAARKHLFQGAMSGVCLDMEQMFSELLADIVWPRETLVSFEVSGGGKQIQLSVDLPEIAEMPNKTASAPQRGYKLSVKEMGPTWVQKLYMRHIHAIGFRLIGEAFGLLPTIQTVILSAYSQRVNSKTGQVGDEYLYSARVHRIDWEKINFGNLGAIDVVESLNQFELRRSMTKTGIFKPIEPLAIQ